MSILCVLCSLPNLSLVKTNKRRLGGGGGICVWDVVCVCVCVWGGVTVLDKCHMHYK